jgi:hypothetical protein
MRQLDIMALKRNVSAKKEELIDKKRKKGVI